MSHLRRTGARGPLQFVMGWVGGIVSTAFAIRADLFDDIGTLRGIAWAVVCVLPFGLFLRLPGTPIVAAIAFAAAWAWAYHGYSGDPDGFGPFALLAIPVAGYFIVAATWLFHLAYLAALEKQKPAD